VCAPAIAGMPRELQSESSRNEHPRNADGRSL
jgi:hypothetical protein